MIRKIIETTVHVLLTLPNVLVFIDIIVLSNDKIYIYSSLLYLKEVDKGRFMEKGYVKLGMTGDSFTRKKGELQVGSEKFLERNDCKIEIIVMLKTIITA